MKIYTVIIRQITVYPSCQQGDGRECLSCLVRPLLPSVYTRGGGDSMYISYRLIVISILFVMSAIGETSISLKARTHRLILRGFVAESAVESADSIPESADSTTDFTIVGRLSISNMFPHQPSRPTRVCRLLLSTDSKLV